MLGPGHLVAHVDVVGPHPRGEQLLHQQLHHLRIVVHALEQHGLAAQGDAGIGQHAQAGHRGGCQLVGVVEMRVDVQRMMLLEDRAQLGRDTLRHVARHPASDPHYLDVLDRPQAAADVVEPPVRQQ